MKTMKTPASAWIGTIPTQWSNQEPISVKITGPVYVGKTLLGVIILKALEERGYTDVGFTDHESSHATLNDRYESLCEETPDPHVFTRPIRIEEIHQRPPTMPSTRPIWSAETIALFEKATEQMNKTVESCETPPAEMLEIQQRLQALTNKIKGA